MRLSLKKILNFNKNFNIHPGHNNSSTIEEQKQKNYYLKFQEVIYEKHTI